jgi:hypothetical protein
VTATTLADELGLDQQIGDDFLDLLVADTDWVDAEFDAIIAAGWNPGGDNGRPSDRPLAAGGSQPETDPPLGTVGHRRPRSRVAVAPATQRRGRSPPARNVLPLGLTEGRW